MTLVHSMQRLLPALAAASLVGLGAAAPVASAAGTRTLTVSTTADGAVTPTQLDACRRARRGCTLRAAIQAASDDRSAATLIVVRIPAGTYRLLLGALELVSPRPGTTVRIAGAGSTRTTIDGGAGGRPMVPLDRALVLGGGRSEVVDLTIQHGDAPIDGSGGGGILARGSAEVTVRRARLLDNRAEFGAAIVQETGRLGLDRVTVVGNASPTGVGPIFGYGDVHIERSTIAGNTSVSAAPGGGAASATALEVIDSTLTGNGGDSVLSGATVTVDGTTIVGNTAPAAIRSSVATLIHGSILSATTACAGAPVVAYGSVIDGTGCALDATSVQAPPGVAPLGLHGGPTATMPPLPGSPALDRMATCPSLALDQRGGHRPAGSGCDAGAVEVGSHVDLRTTLAAPARVRVGRPLVVRATLRNLGADATTATVTVSIGGRLRTRGTLPASCATTMTPGSVACTVTLRAGGSRTVSLRLRARSRGIATVRAAARFSGTDLRPADDGTSRRVRITRR